MPPTATAPNPTTTGVPVGHRVLTIFHLPMDTRLFVNIVTQAAATYPAAECHNLSDTVVAITIPKGD